MSANEARVQGVVNAALSAAHNAGSGNRLEKLQTAIGELTDPREIASALLISSVQSGGHFNQTLQAIFSGQLQVLLTERHVAAQEAMSKAANRMTIASVALAAVSAALGIAQLFAVFL